MTAIVDLTGQRFGRRVVLAQEGRGHGHVRWRVRCDCGKESVVYRGSLMSGMAQSCRCLAKDVQRERWRKYREWRDTSAKEGLNATISR